MAQPKKAAPDWERIEADYRAGVLSIREIAASQGITDTAIRKRAKKEEWVRDLAERIQAKADALVRTAQVRSEVRSESTISERELIATNAETVAAIKLAHRRDISRARALAMSLLGELELQTSDPGLFERLGELVLDTGTEAESKLLEAYRRVLSTPGRIDGMKKLSDTLKTLVGLERESYGIATPQEVNLNANIKSERKPQDMTDDELLAIATGGGAGTTDPA